MLSEISQIVKDKGHRISLTCGLKTDKQSRNRPINKEDKLTVARGHGGREMSKRGDAEWELTDFQ